MSLIDDARFDEFMSMLDKADVKELYEDYYNEEAIVVEEIINQSASGNTSDLRKSLHTLIGSSSNVGASAVANLCRQASELIHADNTNDAIDLLKDLPQIFEATMQKIRKKIG